MTSKTTVAIDQPLRKKLKKLAIILDISQGEVIKRAVTTFEKSVLSQFNEKKGLEKESAEDINIKKILEEATQKVYASDPELKAIHEKLQAGPETIDDFIISHWDSGLE